MEKTDFKNLSADTSAIVSLDDEQLLEGRKLMENIFLKLLRIDEEDNIRWRGTLYDLVELARVAYDSGIVRDAQGYPMAFARLVKTICHNLHVRPPYSPYNIAARATRRKGVKRYTLVERFCYLKYVARVDNPIAMELEQIR